MPGKVAIIANPMSGRDVRRLAARATTMTHEVKRDLVARIALGLDAMGVDEIMILKEPYRVSSGALEILPLRARVRLGPVALELGATLLFPLIRPRFFFAPNDSTVFEVPPVGAQAFAGCPDRRSYAESESRWRPNSRRVCSQTGHRECTCTRSTARRRRARSMPPSDSAPGRRPREGVLKAS